jgi:methylmalonyl-CoA mutase
MEVSTRSLGSLESLLEEFPPVSTETWESTIRADLKGADYDKRLVWKTEEGVAVRPYYRAEHATARQPLPRGGTDAWVMTRPDQDAPVDVEASRHHEAGATAVQELAFALAEASDRLSAERPVGSVRFAIGSNHFMEIAKLRAARLLWAQLRQAYGLPAAPLAIHAVTAGENKTLFDPYVNLLRVTTEALSAVLGGCDALTITPCRFDAHLAENVDHILREESHLDKVMDPGAGSYYVEALTDQVAAEAWTQFQAIEAAGGFAAWSVSGSLDAALAASRQAKEKAVASRRRVLVGTNNYPNVKERELEAAGQLPSGWRLASAFEAIRLRTERHAKRTGRTPRVLLLERGDLKMRKARATFCQNFFGCAGFEILQGDRVVDAELIVLCSSDPEYLALANEICPTSAVPVIVAGYPKDQVEVLKAAGVADFVHVLSNAVDTLTAWQARLGIED